MKILGIEFAIEIANPRHVEIYNAVRNLEKKKEKLEKLKRPAPKLQEEIDRTERYIKTQIQNESNKTNTKKTA